MNVVARLLQLFRPGFPTMDRDDSVARAATRTSAAASDARTQGAPIAELSVRLRTWHRAVCAAVSVVVVLGAGAFLPIVPQAQAAGPEWKLTVTPIADYLMPEPDETAAFTIEAENVGDAPTNGPITIENTPPSGLLAHGVHFLNPAVFRPETTIPSDLAAAGLCSASFQTCEYPGLISPPLPHLAPGQKLVMQIRLAVPTAATGTVEDQAIVSGGGAATMTASATATVTGEPAFGLHSFAASVTESPCEIGAISPEPFVCHPYTQAGGHPYQFTTEFKLATVTEPAIDNEWGENGISPAGDPRDLVAELPPGLIANPQAVPHCSLAQFFANECSPSTIVGTVGFRAFGKAQGGLQALVPLFNLQPTGDFPGELGYQVSGGLPYLITAGVRSASDYGVSAGSFGLPPANLTRVRVTIWGVPAEHSHDALRGKDCGHEMIAGKEAAFWYQYFDNSPAHNEAECAEDIENGLGPLPHGGPAEVEPTPFLTLPSECSGESLTVVGRSRPWRNPAEEATASSTLPPVVGCNRLEFRPTIEAHPTTDLADSPSGFDFDLKVPQNHAGPEGKEDPRSLSTADLKEAVVTLPPGLVVNPSSGVGLTACSPEQIGLTTPVGQTPAHFTEAPAQCPDASKLGTVEVKTQLLHEPLGSIEPLPGRVGSVYLATPHQNPSGGLLAGYIVLEGEGVIIKLAGKFQADPRTGQITASFAENPQLPFEEFRFHFFEGARGALRTPATCGTYEVTSTLTPWSAPESGPPAEPTSEFETNAGPSGGACPTSAAAEPHAPAFRAGTESPAAGAYSPFSLKLVRQDGEQEISQIETTLPEGLVGRLAGTTYCPDAALASAAGKSGVAEQQSPSCPSSSEVGSVDVAAGAGPTPLNVPGKAYLAGPYKGAPLSLAIVTPAVAGPFDLGTVVVRTALFVDPLTTEITAKSDPIPTILEGIPLDVRQITLQMNKPKFTLNPTSCEPKQITGTALTSLGASASLTQRFQVGGCPALGFKPGLQISLKGSTRHAGHPGLKAVVTYPQKGSYANIASAQVNLPHSEFIDQANLNKTCTKPVLLEGACPAKSIYGKAKAWTPLLEKPLEGPVYLVGGFGYKLPALVAELDGQIKVLLVGKVDSGKNKGIRNTFEAVPDAPVEKFVLEMKGGKKYSLLENSENLCARPQKAIASFTAQSGKVLNLHPTVANDCGKRGKKHKGKRHHGGHADGHGKGGHGASRSRALDAVLSRGW
jgi:hypothetical protein